MFVRFIISRERNCIVGCGSIVETKMIYIVYCVMGGCRFFPGLGVFLLLLWVVTGLGFVPVFIITIIIIVMVLQCDVLCPFFYTFRKVLLTTVM